MQHDLTTTPTAISGLSASVRYTVQNQTPGGYVVLAVTATAPTDADDDGYILGPLESAAQETTITLAAGESLYAWMRDGTGSIWVGLAA